VLAAVNHAGPDSGVYGLAADGDAIAPPARALPPVRSLAVAGPRVFAATERGLWERSGAEWRQVAELGERRVEQVVAAGSRVVARAGDGLWESPGAGARFHPLPFHHGPPRALALSGGEALWVSGDAGLYRLAGGENHSAETPLPDGRIEAAGDRLLAWGERGAFVRPLDGGPWAELAAEATAVLPTGDRRWPVVIVTPAGAFLAGHDAVVGGAASEAPGDTPAVTLRPLDLPAPPASASAALIAGDRLYLGTSGWGLWVAALAPPPTRQGGSPSRPAARCGAGRALAR
jgi:hypothetical protein